MRARYADIEGYVERDGVRTFYEVYGSDGPTILLMPAWSIVHSRIWKAQVPYLARHARVITFDGRGNGRSDRPEGATAYAEQEFADDALAVLDATDTTSAVVVGFSLGCQRALLLASQHPDRVSRLALIAPSVPLPPADPKAGAGENFEWDLPSYDGWLKFNRRYWRSDFEGFLRFFFSEVFVEPHSTKQIEDCVAWGLETDGETLIATATSPRLDSEQALRDVLATVRCPLLVMHGTDDHVCPHDSGEALAKLAGAPFISLGGSGHAPITRDPVKVNLMLRDFACPPFPSAWTRGRARRKRVLFVSSPIGLGHIRRDLAIADELRRLHDGLQIDWLAQHPVTEVLAARGERIHPASAVLASESGHFESESAEHDLHCFQAWRRMDEIIVSNFMVFHDVVRDDPYDLWVGDEAWELDYYLHENPELKTSAFAWLTDFVGWLPIADGGEAEAFLTADYNAEMIEHIDRFPRVRDRAIFVGDPEDIVPCSFGADLPLIRSWTEEHFDFAGYITGFEPADVDDRAELRAQLGFGPDEAVCVVTVGGSGVGGDLLRRVMAAFPEAKRRVPALRMIVVTGPRIDPAALGAHDGLDVRSYVPDLYRHLAACDLAVVQGGLTTAMELTANRRPFLYFPLGHHFEQQIHVRHRLERHRAGRAMDYRRDGPAEIAAAIAEEIGRTVDYRAVPHDGARRAAGLLAELL